MNVCGGYDVSLDERGRTRVPSKIRHLLGDNPYITIGNNGSLRLVTQEDFLEMRKKLDSIPKTDLDGQSLRMVVNYISYAIEEDSQNRFSITKKLRVRAGIIKNCIFLPMDGYIEVWSKEKFDIIIEKALNNADVDSAMDKYEI